MSFKKRIAVISIVSMIITMLIGCTNNFANKLYDNNSKIADAADSYGVDESNEVIEEGIYEGSMKLSGSLTIWNYESTEEFDLQIPYTFTVKSGKAKLVLISPDDKVITLAENSDKTKVDGSTLLNLNYSSKYKNHALHGSVFNFM